VLVANIQRGIEDARAGRVTRYEPGYFTKLAAELGPDEDD
jgi:hypothetical protein